MHIEFKHLTLKPFLLLALASTALLASCADAEGPKARDANIPPPQNAAERQQAINERPDPIQYLPLGEDVLLPEAEAGDPLPSTVVGPYELRNETLAGALQLVMDGTNIPVSFETTRGLENTITVTNLKGPLKDVVRQICGLADLYCSYEHGVLNVKDTEIFTVSIPPIATSEQLGTLMTNVGTALSEITGQTAVTDPSTRTIVYRASARTDEVARRYFQRLRQNTALIVFETYIWEVSLNSGNSTGINWDFFENIGSYNLGIALSGSPLADLGTPVSIGLPTKGPANLTTGDVLRFISNYGAVKTISQPQITVLAGSEARLRVADTQNYLASVSRTTTDGGTSTLSSTTDSVDSGFTLIIGSNWDNATVYGNINILLQEVRNIEIFPVSDTDNVQLPNTSERELQTQVRVRPGDALLIAGLVRERDNLDSQGPGMNEPIIPSSRTVQTDNVELVFLLKPRVVVFTQKKPELPPPAFPADALKSDPEIMADASPVVPLPPEVEVAPEPAASKTEKPETMPAPLTPEKKADVVKEDVDSTIPKTKRVADAKPADPLESKVEVEKETAGMTSPQSLLPAGDNSAMEQEKVMMPSARRITPSEASGEAIVLPTVRRIDTSATSTNKTLLENDDMTSGISGAI